MPKPVHHEEIEIKLRVPDLGVLRSRLKHIRAQEIIPRTHELNTLFDTPSGHLRRSGRLIRLRVEQIASTYGKKRVNENLPAILTYKGPPLASHKARKAAGKSEIRGPYKVKDEAETAVSEAGQTAGILHALGLRPAFRYEKFRTTYALPGVRGLKVELDETPVGTYLELEGPVKSIDRAARLLGYARPDYLTETYGSLHIAACRRRRIKPGDMLFTPTKNLR